MAKLKNRHKHKGFRFSVNHENKKYSRFLHSVKTRPLSLLIMEKDKKVAMKGKKSAALQPAVKEKVGIRPFQ